MTLEKYKVVGSFNESKKFDYDAYLAVRDERRARESLCPSAISKTSKNPKEDIILLNKFFKKKYFGVKK